VTKRTKIIEFENRILASEERLRLGKSAAGIATFDLDLASRSWKWSSNAGSLFGLGDESPTSFLASWEKAVFFDDAPKISSAIDNAAQNGNFYVEFRVAKPREVPRWLVAKR
jgi:hypothetical protein